MSRSDVWLNIPQAVVLEATGDLEQAQGIKDSDPRLLVMKATLRLAPRLFMPVAADATASETRLAFEKLREEMDVPINRNYRYQDILRKVQARLIAGVTVKGSRNLNLPLEVIDPAEFVRLELYGIDAIDPRTQGLVWRNLLINARELAEAAATLPVKRKWDCTGDPHPNLIEWARSKWGDAPAQMPGRDELLRLHRQEFGRVPGISENSMRDLRRALVPASARRGGAPTHRR